MSKIETKTRDDGTVIWVKDGFVHREDGPALIKPNGTKEWYRDGLLHREDGPAMEYANGDKVWYFKGKIHREGGPAIEQASGDKYWMRNGVLHREDGPAALDKGVESWWLYGEELDENGIKAQQQKIRLQFALQAAKPSAIEAPFRGTLASVIAPEKAAFKNRAGRKQAGVRP